MNSTTAHQLPSFLEVIHVHTIEKAHDVVGFTSDMGVLKLVISFVDVTFTSSEETAMRQSIETMLLMVYRNRRTGIECLLTIE